MISYIEGKIILKKEKYIVVLAGPVGYKVYLSKINIAKVPGKGTDIKLFAYLSVGENKMDLYGFLTEDELDFFEVLEQVRGIGPKTALEISAIGSLDKIKKRIEKNDGNVFEGVSGIGKKKAMSIVLELSGKIKNLEKTKQPILEEAEDALVNLGFARPKVKEALKNIKADGKDSEEILKEALNLLS
jgi:Holliday junction DNA helicase RuvA